MRHGEGSADRRLRNVAGHRHPTGCGTARAPGRDRFRANEESTPMSEMVKRLRERRANVWEQMKGLADKAAEENRAFEAAEQGQWDAMNDELDKLDER